MILILDFGSQYTQVIARKIRESHVYCEIFPGNKKLDEIQNMDSGWAEKCNIPKTENTGLPIYK